MTQYNDLETMALWVKYGGAFTAAPMAASIASAESGLKSDSVGHNTNGTTDNGLWQINSTNAPPSQMLDPVLNVQKAIAMSNNGQTWRPWCTAYSDGACGSKGGGYLGSGTPGLRRVSSNQAALSNFLLTNQASNWYDQVLAGVGQDTGSANPPTGSGNPLTPQENPGQSSGGLFGGSLIPSGWLHALLGGVVLVAGGAAMLVGIVLLASVKVAVPQGLAGTIPDSDDQLAKRSPQTQRPKYPSIKATDLEGKNF